MAKSKKTDRVGSVPADEGEPLAAAEAAELLASIDEHLRVLQQYAALEARSLADRAPTTKRLARIRLVHDDLQSASKFASKQLKS